MFSCEFCEISKNTFSYRTPPVAASVNRHINGGKVHFKSFPGSKGKQLNPHTIPILEEHQYDTAAIHVWIIDLL